MSKRTAIASAATGIMALSAVAFAGTACAKDGASYQAGRATGMGWANATLASAGGGGIPDAEIQGICPELAASAARTQTYYYSGGQIPGTEIVNADFISGCLNGARSAIG